MRKFISEHLGELIVAVLAGIVLYYIIPQSGTSSVADEKISNNQRTVYMHRCRSADYGTPEFKNLEDAYSAIESALYKEGFSSVKPGDDRIKCDVRGLTVIYPRAEDEVSAKAATSAIQNVLPANRKAYSSLQRDDKDHSGELGVWFLMPASK